MDYNILDSVIESDKQKRILQLMQEIDLYSKGKGILDSFFYVKGSSYDTILFDGEIQSQSFDMLCSIIRMNNPALLKYYKMGVMESLDNGFADNGAYILMEFSRNSKYATVFSKYQQSPEFSANSAIYARYRKQACSIKPRNIEVAFTHDVKQCATEFAKFLEKRYKKRLIAFESQEIKYQNACPNVSFKVNGNRLNVFLYILEYYKSYCTTILDSFLSVKNYISGMPLATQLDCSNLIAFIRNGRSECKTNLLIVDFLLDYLKEHIEYYIGDFVVSVSYSLYCYIITLINCLFDSYCQPFSEHQSDIVFFNELLAKSCLKYLKLEHMPEEKYLFMPYVLSDIKHCNEVYSNLFIPSNDKFPHKQIYLTNTDLFHFDTSLEVRKLLS